jgi:hypothetical protein
LLLVEKEEIKQGAGKERYLQGMNNLRLCVSFKEIPLVAGQLIPQVYLRFI